MDKKLLDESIEGKYLNCFYRDEYANKRMDKAF